MAERSAVATKDIGAYIETIASATGDATRAIDSVRKMADQLASLTTRASNEATALAGSRKSLTEAIAQWRFVGQGETEITRILHERRNELTRVLGPLSPLVADTHTPLGEALRNLLAALGENPARPDSRD
jgi:methyl-accepting chemotaxis protein